MTRIFLVLALVALSLLAANLVVGLSLGDVNGITLRVYHGRREARRLELALRPDEQALSAAREEAREAEGAFAAIQGRVRLHRLLGLAAALVAILVNSIAVTYFVGTSRWCREVGDAYSLAPELAARSVRLKSATFPWSALGIVATLTIAALGAASDPTANHIESAGGWVSSHYLAAVMGIAIIAFAFWQQTRAIGRNYAVIQQIVAEVRTIRAARGLE